jgi:hypothetical protein
MQRRPRQSAPTPLAVSDNTLELALRRSDSTEAPNFVSIELQTDRLVAFSAEPLATDRTWEMASGDFKLVLNAVAVERRLPPSSRYAYEMTPTAPRPNLENDLLRLSEGATPRPSNELYVFCALMMNGCFVRVSRYNSTGILDAMVCTLGTRIPYRMHTTDISRSGLFLASASGESIPFSNNTLLEITIKPATGDLEQRPIRFMGKVVRCVNSNLASRKVETVGIGVQIVEMEHDVLQAWEKCLKAAAQRSEQKSA